MASFCASGLFVLRLSMTLFRLTNIFCWHLSGIATVYSDKITNATTTDPEVQTNSLITNIFLEVSHQYRIFSWKYSYNFYTISGLKEHILCTEWIPIVHPNSTGWCGLVSIQKRSLICHLWW